MDNTVGDTYQVRHGLKPFSVEQAEIAQRNAKKIAEIKAEQARRKVLTDRARETIQGAIEKRKSQELFHFKVRGTTHHDIKKMVTFARKNDLFDPYDGWTASDIKEFSPYDEVFETDLSGVLTDLKLITEPENKYDPNAIKVIAYIDEHEFMLGYVPKEYTAEVKGIMISQQDGKIDLHVEYELTGGKYKIAEEDDDDFSDDPKLKMHTGNFDYGFNIVLLDENIE
ncbi:hypothetical protein IV55_GL000684 [Furfurilactobacillus siliginis]|nr:hypothetical protein IV55_GL000684 [Furfurilactobacillus siliginis]